MFTTPIRAWEKEQRQAAKASDAEYRARMSDWEAADAGFKDAARKRAREGQECELDPRHLQHELSKPAKPRVPEILRQDATPEALVARLAQYGIGAILSAEAGIIFGSHGMNPDAITRNLAQMNVLWDGGHIKRDRTTQESAELDGARLTIGLQVQPAVLENFLDESGALAKGIGFFARFLLSYPQSTQGRRFYKPPTEGNPALNAFQARMKVLLAFPVTFSESGSIVTTVLPLNREAHEVWVEFHDEVEEQLNVGGEYYDVKEVANKAADNAARIACGFHAFELCASYEIGPEHMRRAVVIMRWHLHEALRFAKLAGVPEVIRNAEAVEQFLVTALYSKKIARMTVSDIQRAGPSRVRKKEHLDAALDQLELHHRARRMKSGKRVDVELNPAVVAEYHR